MYYMEEFGTILGFTLTVAAKTIYEVPPSLAGKLTKYVIALYEIKQGYELSRSMLKHWQVVSELTYDLLQTEYFNKVEGGHTFYNRELDFNPPRILKRIADGLLHCQKISYLADDEMLHILGQIESKAPASCILREKYLELYEVCFDEDLEYAYALLEDIKEKESLISYPQGCESFLDTILGY